MECPYCNDLTHVPKQALESDFPFACECCGGLVAVDPDGDFSDGDWHDASALVPVKYVLQLEEAMPGPISVRTAGSFDAAIDRAISVSSRAFKARAAFASAFAPRSTSRAPRRSWGSGSVKWSVSSYEPSSGKRLVASGHIG
jgi:hypothetical protein